MTPYELYQFYLNKYKASDASSGTPSEVQPTYTLPEVLPVSETGGDETTTGPTSTGKGIGSISMSDIGKAIGFAVNPALGIASLGFSAVTGKTPMQVVQDTLASIGIGTAATGPTAPGAGMGFGGGYATDVGFGGMGTSPSGVDQGLGPGGCATGTSGPSTDTGMGPGGCDPGGGDGGNGGAGAGGGDAGSGPGGCSYAKGGRVGFNEGSKLTDYIKTNISASTSSSSPEEGVKIKEEILDGIVSLNIPLSEKLKLLGELKFGKNRAKVDLSELGKKYGINLGEEVYKDKYLSPGLGAEYTTDEGTKFNFMVNPEDKGGSVSVSRSFATGGRVGYAAGTVLTPKPGAIGYIESSPVYRILADGSLGPRVITDSMVKEFFGDSTYDGEDLKKAFGENITFMSDEGYQKEKALNQQLAAGLYQTTNPNIIGYSPSEPAITALPRLKKQTKH